jgi:hypothetical protein
MRRTILIMALVMPFAACVYGADNAMYEMQMSRPVKHMMAEKAPFELELKYARNGVPGTPLGPDNSPWSTAVNASSINSGNPDRDIHMAYGSDGSIWLSWDANQGDYDAAMAKSSDHGATWDERYWGVSASYDFEHSCIVINAAGYLRLWTTLSGGGYTNEIAWLESMSGYPNDIDNLDGWYIFTSGAPDRHDPDGAAWGGVDNSSGVEVIGWTDEGTNPDTVEIWWSDDWGLNGWSYVRLGNADEYNEMRPAVAVCVPGDTFRMIAFEEDSLNNFNVDFWRIDSITSSVWFHGWSTYHFGGSRCPALAAEGDYAYVAYEIDDGTGQWDILFNYSVDAGDNWNGSFEYVANHATNDERHPRLTSEGQRVGVTYTYDSGSITNRFKSSDSNGASGTWGTEEIVTDATSTEDGVHCVEVMWYGGNNNWYAAWTDTRSGAADVYSSYKAGGTSQIITIPATPDSFIYFNYSSKLVANSFITKYCERVYDPVLSENIQEKMAKADEGEFLGVLITMKDQITTDWLLARAAPMKRREKAKFVGNELRTFADETQADLFAYLAQKEKEGKAKDFGSIFTGNRVYAHVTKDVILEIAQRDDVGWLMPELKSILADAHYGSYAEEVAEPDAVEGHVTAINADDVWATGYAGQGIIVGVMDTGVNYGHNDVNDHLWTGNGNYSFGGWDFENNDNRPNDDDGHGSFTCGVVCGDGTNGDTTGVAPECSLMILRVANNSHMHSAVDFAIAGGKSGTGYGEPADVFQSSVGFERGQFTTEAEWENMKNEFRPDAISMLAAGILWTYAAGNGDSYGGGHYSVPNDIIVAANCPPPWLHPDQAIIGGVSATVAVGACSNARSRQSWSSYGPSDWNNSNYSDYPYGGSNHGLLKPDIMAPGANLTSIARTGEGYQSGWSGTSFAAPCLAGACALILSKDFSLTPARLDSLVEVTAVPVISYDPAGKDSLNGSGFLDVQAACLGIGNAQKGILKVINDPLATGNLMVSGITHKKSWVVKVEPTSFTVAPGDTQLVDVWADTTGFGLGPGPVIHYDTLFIQSNSQSKTTTIVEVQLQIGPLNITMNTLTATGYISRIELKWRTASEYNLEAWQVTRSETAEGDYTIVRALEGHGTTGLPNDYKFVDNAVEPGRQYYYKLVAIDNMGKTTYGPVSATALIGPSVNGLRLAMNPARSPKVLFTVSNSSKVSLKVYDLTGRLVRTLVNGVLSPNSYVINWDGKNEAGRVAGNGVYFIRMSSDGEDSTIKVTLIK